MKIRMITILAGPKFSAQPDQVIDVTSKEAKGLIDGGYAVKYVDPKVEEAKAKAKAKAEAKAKAAAEAKAKAKKESATVEPPENTTQSEPKAKKAGKK